MIAVERILPAEDFEKLLDQSVTDLIVVVRVGSSMSYREFEQAVFSSMEKAAEGTAFEGRVSETEEMEFPDIIAAHYYGVEVKQTKKSNFVVSGNSIFEQTRVEGVEFLYVLIGNQTDVVWRHYEEALERIIVTHSPRYAVNADAQTTVFDLMDIPYNEFRELDQRRKMEYVRRLYEDQSLWWLSQSDVPQFRFYTGLAREEKRCFEAEAMIACPQIFGTSTTKFQDVAVLGLRRGYVIPNVRDHFTAGGQVLINGRYFPRIFGRAVKNEDLLRQVIVDMDDELLEQFWGFSVPEDPDERWAMWVRLADASNNQHNLSDVLR